MTLLRTALVLLISMSLSGTGTMLVDASSKRKECLESMTWAYDETRATARFEINLPKCWRGESVYKVKAWIERTEVGAADPTRAVVRRKCDPTRVCRVPVRMAHPTGEAASYRTSIEYAATPNGAQISHRVYTCVSGADVTRCEQI